MSLTQWVEDPTLEAPDGHLWVKPVDVCPNCDCCTRALCEKGATSTMGCLRWVGETDDETRERVRVCPCPKAPSPWDRVGDGRDGPDT